MTAKRRFITFLSAYVAASILAVAGVSVYVLQHTIALFTGAENPAYAAIMGDRILQRTMLGYGLLVAVILAVTVPIGIVLSRLISGAYLRVFEDLTRLAGERLGRDPALAVGEDERRLLQNYLDVLVADQERLRDYEKMEAWKDGARMLMHELKNPLTPLKLSAEVLSLRGEDPRGVEAEVDSILTATRDVETILAMFKDLVNMEFGPRETIPAGLALEAAFGRLRAVHGDLDLRWRLPDKPVAVVTEPTLLSMVVANLVNNGREANPRGFFVEIAEEPDAVVVTFVTLNRRIASPERVFRLDYSDHGRGRGYGLYLSRLISDYLDLDLSLTPRGEDVVFSIRLRKPLARGGRVDRTAPLEPRPQR